MLFAVHEPELPLVVDGRHLRAQARPSAAEPSRARPRAGSRACRGDPASSRSASASVRRDPPVRRSSLSPRRGGASWPARGIVPGRPQQVRLLRCWGDPVTLGGHVKPRAERRLGDRRPQRPRRADVARRRGPARPPRRRPRRPASRAASSRSSSLPPAAAPNRSPATVRRAASDEPIPHGGGGAGRRGASRPSAPCRSRLARGPDDFRPGRVAAILHLEGAEPLDAGLATSSVVRARAPVGRARLGAGERVRGGRSVPLPVLAGHGAGPHRRRPELVRRVQPSSAILVDLSHLNEAGFWDVARLSTAPLVATHSNAHAISPGRATSPTRSSTRSARREASSA